MRSRFVFISCLFGLAACHFEPGALVGNNPDAIDPSTQVSYSSPNNGVLRLIYSVDAPNCTTPSDDGTAILSWGNPRYDQVGITFRQLADGHHAKVNHLFYRPVGRWGPDEELKCENVPHEASDPAALVQQVCTLPGDPTQDPKMYYIVSKLELQNDACAATAIFTVAPLSSGDGSSILSLSSISSAGSLIPPLTVSPQ